jgi:chromosome segregation ATPase
MNSTPKYLGHNKLQLQIDEMEQIIEKYKHTEKESETKINLFKKTITTLQGQLQEKSAQISRLETSHIDPQYEKQIIDLNEIINKKNSEIVNINELLNNSKTEIDYLKRCFDDMKLERDTCINQLDDLRQRYASLETSHQRQAVQLQMNTEVISKLQNQIGFQESMKSDLENEMESMKSELVKYRTDIRNMTIEKDAEIESLKKQLETFDSKKVTEKNIDNSKIQGGPLPKKETSRRRLPVTSRRGPVRV